MAIEASVAHFTLVGQLKNIIVKSKNTIKYLELATEQENLQIKVTKELSNQIKRLPKQLKPGCKLKIQGVRKHKLDKEKIKYKGYQLELLEPIETTHSNQFVSPQKNNSQQAKVLFCQKSTCWKKGGKAACQALKAELKNRGLEEQVTIKTTGCLKQCKKAPNMILMPDKARYSKVESKQINKIIDRHLVAK